MQVSGGAHQRLVLERVQAAVVHLLQVVPWVGGVGDVLDHGLIALRPGSTFRQGVDDLRRGDDILHHGLLDRTDPVARLGAPGPWDVLAEDGKLAQLVHERPQIVPELEQDVGGHALGDDSAAEDDVGLDGDAALLNAALHRQQLLEALEDRRHPLLGDDSGLDLPIRLPQLADRPVLGIGSSRLEGLQGPGEVARIAEVLQLQVDGLLEPVVARRAASEADQDVQQGVGVLDDLFVLFQLFQRCHYLVLYHPQVGSIRLCQ